jgi:hypothetical protein
VRNNFDNSPAITPVNIRRNYRTHFIWLPRKFYYAAEQAFRVDAPYDVPCIDKQRQFRHAYCPLTKRTTKL